jgi:hypothetical protein
MLNFFLFNIFSVTPSMETGIAYDVSFIGTPEHVNDALRYGLTYTPVLDWSGTATLDINVSDVGHALNTPPELNLHSYTSYDIVVVPVNDPALLTFESDSSSSSSSSGIAVEIEEDTTYTVPALHIVDVDVPLGKPIQLTVWCSYGAVALNEGLNDSTTNVLLSTTSHVVIDTALPPSKEGVLPTKTVVGLRVVGLLKDVQDIVPEMIYTPSKDWYGVDVLTFEW